MKDHFGLADQIKAEAKALGFSLFGICKPSTPPHLEVYEKWIADQRYSGMTYLAREDARIRRADPASNLEDCRSILVMGFPYQGPGFAPHPDDDIPRGRIAAYALGQDYHLAATKQASKLVNFILFIDPSLKYSIYIDTGPILERDLAQMAGLGWIGKNTCLISPEQGSYFFLVNIFTNLELQASEPFDVDRCGHCTRCLEACPTHCILPDRTIDAGRCISYLTIENKGDIPVELRQSIGNWVFGCDVCQMVCPWNRKHQAQPGSPYLISNENHAYPPLVDYLKLTEAEFKVVFRDSAILRSRRRGFIRNIAVAMGNNPLRGKYLPELTFALEKEEDPVIRKHILWAIGQIRLISTRQFLQQQLEDIRNTPIRSEIESALADFSDSFDNSS